MGSNLKYEGALHLPCTIYHMALISKNAIRGFKQWFDSRSTVTLN